MSPTTPTPPTQHNSSPALWIRMGVAALLVVMGTACSDDSKTSEEFDTAPDTRVADGFADVPSDLAFDSVVDLGETHQVDTEADVGFCPDEDDDGVCDADDACPGGDDRADYDGDGVPDACDPCPLDPADDSDGDGVCDSDDACPDGDDGVDGDSDGVADACDPCPADVFDDDDHDGVCNSDDLCPGGDDRIDTDGDGIPNACDDCHSTDDSDSDGVVDDCDACPGGDDTVDENGDGRPDPCDPCFPDPCVDQDHMRCDPDLGACVCENGWCEIDGVCVDDGELHPESTCLVCDVSNNPVDWSLRPTGSICRAALNVCDLPETCDGVNPECPDDVLVAAGTPCGDDPTECSNQDTCDGAGACVPNHLAAGAACGDAGTPCVVQDTCDGSGACVDQGFAEAGTLCGDGPTECSDQDTCDGAGTCLRNDFPEGHGCGETGTECRPQDTCDGSGACADQGFVAMGTLCGDGFSECSAQDACDGAGTCLPNDFPEGHRCGDVGTECRHQDICDGSGVCVDHGFVQQGAPCGAAAEPCSAADACDGAGACLPHDFPAGAPCDDGEETTYGDVCSAPPGGTCAGATHPHCASLHDAEPSLPSGIYWIDPDGDGAEGAIEVFCDMTTAGGGWTLVVVYGDDGRPTQWTGLDYPRPGAAAYGEPDAKIFDEAANASGISNYSLPAAFLWGPDGAQIMAYVGGTTDDYVLAALPAGCNPFDGATVCPEDVHGPFPVIASDGSTLTDAGYICTTAHGAAPYESDPYNEFGLHLIDGFDSAPGLHCHWGSSQLGHQQMGRIFVTLEGAAEPGSSSWAAGVHSHFNAAGQYNQPGALLVRPQTPCRDVDFDGVCWQDDDCPQAPDPGQEDEDSNGIGDACEPRDCLAVLAAGDSQGDGIYWIDPDGGGGSSPIQVFCDMTTAGGGWTLVAVHGDGDRPAQWSGNDYPRPGASFYGVLDLTILDPDANSSGIPHYSIDASPLIGASGVEVMAYVGGTTDDYVLAALPAGCNYFDGATTCEENTYGPLPVFGSDHGLVTDQAYACTTAHGASPFEADPYDEFGLQLLDGADSDGAHHCFAGASGLGHEGRGRLFVTLEDSGDSQWSTGVHSHWRASGNENQPGALLIRRTTGCADEDFDGVCTSVDNCPLVHNPGQDDGNGNGRGDVCEFKDCVAVLEGGSASGDGVYWIDPDGPGGADPFQTWCDMTTAGGGWTLVAIYGTDGRPSSWTGNPYPRPGASFYGQVDPAIFDAESNGTNISNFSIDASALWTAEGLSVLAYVGGETDDFVLAQLPAGCNVFDATTFCLENTWGLCLPNNAHLGNHHHFAHLIGGRSAT